LNIISVDVGTTNVKVAKVNVSKESIKIVDQVNIRVPAEKPERKAYEHNPHVLFNLISKAIKHLSSGEVDALAFTVYLFGLIHMDKHMKPLSNIITWLDERPIEVLKVLEPYRNELYLRTGCPVLHIYALPKILWFKKHKRELFEKTRYFLDAKSFIMHTFSGEIVSDLSTASGTYQLLNIHNLKWDDLALEIAGVSEDQLPNVVEGTYAATLKEGIAKELGLDSKTPVITGLYDSASMIYGLTLEKENLGVVNIGTSAMLRAITNMPVIDRPNLMRFQTYYFINRKWIGGGGISNAGVVLDYLRNLFNIELGKTEFYTWLFSEIGKKTENKGLLFIPMIYAERLPLLQTTIGGSIVGLTQEVDSIDIFKAAIEGTLFLLKRISDGLIENGVSYHKVIVGGKIAQYPPVQKMLANILNKEIIYCGIPDVSHIGNTLITLKSLKTHSDKEITYLHEEIMKNCIAIKPEIPLQKQYEHLYKRFSEILKEIYG